MRSPTRAFAKACWLAIVAVASMALLADLADARVGGGRSVGSRGAKTYQAPPTTNTAPKTASPMEKSMTQPGKSGAAQSTPAPGASRFGWRSLLLGGLIGAGLASLFGMGALANVLGFVLQAALIGGLIWLAVAFFRGRMGQPALAGAGASSGQAQARPNADYRQAASALGGGGAGLSIGPDDYDAYERLLGDIQTSYGRNDLETLGQRTTPEMLSYFAAELDANAKQGVRNEVSEPKLLQGDLAEAWREADGEYATVAMRFSVLDATVEKASGRVVSGSTSAPQEATEVWTFRRPVNGTPRQWELSAIQQA